MQKNALGGVCGLEEEKLSGKEFVHVMYLQVEIYQRKENLMILS